MQSRAVKTSPDQGGIHCGAGLFLYDPLKGTLKIMFADHVWELKPYLLGMIDQMLLT